MKTKLLLVLVFTVCTFNVNAQTVGTTFIASNNIEYRVTSVPDRGNPTVKAFDYSYPGSQEIVIPRLVSHLGVTYAVTAIGPRAFESRNITSVTIGNLVTKIEWEAFKGNNLTHITIPDSVTEIGDAAFTSNDLNTISLPEGLITIGNGVFSNNNLTSVLIPDSVTTIGATAFTNNNLTSVTFGSSVTSIGISSFLENDNLTEVISRSVNPAPLSVYTILEADRINMTLTIPQGTTQNYIDQNWTGFGLVVEDTTLSITEVALSNQLKVITNTNSLTVISNTISVEQVEVYAITGAKVAFDMSNQIAIHHLNTGIYIAKIYTNKGITTQKFIKK